MKQQLKADVHDFWNDSACGEDLFLVADDKAGFEREREIRYSIEPYIPDFALFSEAKEEKVLEVGVGLGADHQSFAESGAIMCGIDLTEKAIQYTRKRFELFSLKSSLNKGDAEALDFEDQSFDQVYSWGVLHHSPDTAKAVDEVFRVLKEGGVAKIMIYQKWSILGIMLWVRYALLKARPWLSLSAIYARYLESPGTKAYTSDEAKSLFAKFKSVKISYAFSTGDLLEEGSGQRHKGLLLNLARKFFPRRIIKLLFPNAGLFMLIRAEK